MTPIWGTTTGGIGLGYIVIPLELPDIRTGDREIEEKCG
jgi:hypothetical protein